MAKVPVEIKRGDGRLLTITWSDGHIDRLVTENLRKQCPCATCRELRGDTSHAAPLTSKKGLLRVIESTKEEETLMTKVWPVGNYALGIEWGDGHNSGIYTYQYLEEIAGSVH